MIRKRCRQYAEKFLDIQRKEFRRLGVLGNWADPYMSMNPAYEAVTAAELATFVEKGEVVRSKKPIYWCCHCKTALAEAEVEYADHTSPSVFVRFPLPDEGLKKAFAAADPSRAGIVIWTTTPWTLPDNLAVAVHPEFIYVLVEQGGLQYVLARNCWNSAPEYSAGMTILFWVNAAGLLWNVLRPVIPSTIALLSSFSAIMSLLMPAPAAYIPRPDMAAKTMKSV